MQQFEPQPHFTPAELRFLSGLKKLFQNQGSEAEAIQQLVYGAIEKELARPGESSIEAVSRARKTVFMQKYGISLQEANQLIAESYQQHMKSPSEETSEQYKQASGRLRILYDHIQADSRKARTNDTEKLARKSGLQSEEEITKAERRFLKAIAKLLGKGSISLLSSNENLYNMLVRELSKKGESTMEDIMRIVEVGLDTNQRKQITAPAIKKIAEKAGLKSADC